MDFRLNNKMDKQTKKEIIALLLTAIGVSLLTHIVAYFTYIYLIK